MIVAKYGVMLNRNMFDIPLLIPAGRVGLRQKRVAHAYPPLHKEYPFAT